MAKLVIRSNFKRCRREACGFEFHFPHQIGALILSTIIRITIYECYKQESGGSPIVVTFLPNGQ